MIGRMPTLRRLASNSPSHSKWPSSWHEQPGPTRIDLRRLFAAPVETHVSRLVELSAPGAPVACPMIYHCIRYTIDPHKLDDFEAYARKWMEGDIIRRCGGKPLGYFLPKKGLGGPNNVALALIGFESLADYENYRGKLMDDSDARANLAEGEKSHCILVEERSYFYRIE